jgi:hypothetical protein
MNNRPYLLFRKLLTHPCWIKMGEAKEFEAYQVGMHWRRARHAVKIGENHLGRALLGYQHSPFMHQASNVIFLAPMLAWA